MIVDYQAGATLTDLAATYGYGKTGISNALKKSGITLRRIGLTDVQVDDAERLYCEGHSLARVAAWFGVDAGTVRARLVKRGVARRNGSVAPG